MSFPCELTLKPVDGQRRLDAWPLTEVDSLVQSTLVQRDVDVKQNANALVDTPALDLADVRIDFQPGTAQRVEFRLAGAQLTYEAGSHRLTQRAVNDQGQPVEVSVFQNLTPRDGEISLRFLIDRLSVESYAFEGEQFFAAYRAPQDGDAQDSIRAIGGDARISYIEIRRLNSAWNVQPASVHR